MKSELALWCWNDTHGRWDLERRVTTETAGEWLVRFKRDDPHKQFVISDRKPPIPKGCVYFNSKGKVMPGKR